MSNSLLEEIKGGSFLPLQLTIAPLQSILERILEMIKDHDNKFQELTNKIDDKANNSALKAIEDAVNQQNQANNDRLMKYDDKLAELEKKLKDITSAQEEIGERQKELEKAQSDIKDTQFEIKEKLSENEENIKNLDPNVRSRDIPYKTSPSQGKSDSKGDSNAINESSTGENDGIIKDKTLTSELPALGEDMSIEDKLRELEQRINDISGKGWMGAMKNKNQKSSKSTNDSENSNTNDDNEDDGQFDIFESPEAFANNMNDIARRISNLETTAESLKENLHNMKHTLINQAPDENLKLQLEKLSSTVDLIRSQSNSQLMSDSPDSNLANQGFGSNRSSSQSKQGKFSPTPPIPAQPNSNRQKVRVSINSGRSNKPNAEKSEPSFDVETFKNDLNQRFDGQDNEIQSLLDKIDQLSKEIAERPNKTVIDQLFGQFKNSFNQILEMLQKSQTNKKQYATKDDLRRLENNLKSVNNELEEAAAARKSMKCLSCGQPYKIVTNSIQDQETMSLLGAAPISQVLSGEQKQTFCYGTDHELYYSNSPKSRPFIASPKPPSTPKQDD